MKIERITIRQVVGNEINLAVRDLMISGLFPDAAKFQGEKEFIPALLAEYGLKLDKIRHDLKGGEISIRDAAETITDMLEEANKNLKRFPTGLKWLNDFVSKKQDEINFASYVLEKIAFECAADEIEETPGYDRLLKIYNSTRADIIANNMGLDEKTTAPQGEKALEIYQKMLETLEDIRNQIAAIKDGAGVSMEKEETETQPKRAENIIREPSYYIKRDLREGDKAYKLMLFLAENVNTYLSMKQLHEFIQSAGSKAHPSSLIFDTKIPKYYSTWPYEIRKEGNLRTAKYGLFAKENAQTEDGAEIARSAAKDVKDAGELQSPHKTQQKQEEKEELTMNELKYFIETNTNRGGNAKRILLKGAEYPLEEGFNLKKAAEECNIEYSQNLYVTILSIVRRFSDKKIQLVHTGKGNFIFRKNVEISEADNGDNGNLQPGADPDGSGNDGDNGDLPPTAKYGLFAKDGAGDVNKFAANAVKPQPETEKKEQADEAGNEAKKPSEPQKPLSQKKPVTETAPIPEEAKKKAVELIENICKHKTTPRYFIWLYLAERLGEKIQKTELIKYLGQKLPAKKWLDQTITNEIRLFNAKQYQYEITADRSRTGSIWSAAYSMILVKTQTAEKETADYQKEIPLNATAEFEEFIKELQRYKRSKKAVETAKAFGSLHINRKLQFLEIMRRCQKQNADVNSANVNYFLTKLINDRSFGKIIVEKAGYGEYIIRVNKEGKKLETAKKGQRDLEYMVEITDSKGKTLTEIIPDLERILGNAIKKTSQRGKAIITIFGLPINTLIKIYEAIGEKPENEEVKHANMESAVYHFKKVLAEKIFKETGIKIVFEKIGKQNFLIKLYKTDVEKRGGGDNLQPGADPDSSGNDGDDGDLPPTAEPQEDNNVPPPDTGLDNNEKPDDDYSALDKKNEEIIINMDAYEEWKTLVLPARNKIEEIVLDFIASREPDKHISVDEIIKYITNKYEPEEFKELHMHPDEERLYMRIQGIFKVLYGKSRDTNEHFYFCIDKTRKDDMEQKEAWIKIKP